MGVMTTTQVNYLDEIVVCYKLQNEEISVDKEDNPYASYLKPLRILRKTEL